jgi:hypothetical protein
VVCEVEHGARGERLSCHRFVANAFRLLLHALAYRLMHALRAAAAVAQNRVEPIGGETRPLRLATAQMDTLRLRLLKVAAHVIPSVRRVLIRLPAAFPLAAAFLAIATWLQVS